ncbi:MAG: hypothetical protein WBK48_05430 [Dethiobacteria bacterium]|nr:hypothetical protein [Bacillota bacterium]HOP69296.1 hypothetical protein [Bacillota bacterium]HPT34324.1 hypothetical protein [Bacillota bacterium]HQD06403.1 hypothetical protein [Bacillota bacterium]
MLRCSLLCCLGLLLWGLWLPAAWASPPGAGAEPAALEGSLPERRLLLLVADRLGYPEFSGEAGPVLSSLAEQGAVALMNVRSGRSGSESGYLSLGTGARAVSGSEGGRAYQRGEAAEGVEAEVLFQRYNGCLPGGEVFCLLPALLHEKNEALNYPVQVGLLGRVMAEHGLTVAVLGNADAGAPGRGAVLIGMDHRGQVPRGRVGEEILLSDPRFPFGKRSHIPALVEEAHRFLEEGAALVIVDFGDLCRLDVSWPELAPRQRRLLLKETMARLDLLLERLLSLLEEGDALMLVVPSPPQNINGGTEQLVPFLLAAEPRGAAGLAVSPTTRRPGLVANTDLVHLIFDYFGFQEGAGPSFGAAMTVASREKPLSFLDQLFRRTVTVYRQRPAVLKGYVLLIIAALLASLAALALKLPFALRISAFLELLMLVPLVLLLLPAWDRFPPEQLHHTALLLAGGLLLGAALLHLLKKQGRYLSWSLLGLGTAFLILLDTLAGASWQKYSFLGYDPVGGSRYYGIGNEYMGVLVGAAILGTVTLVALFDGKREGDSFCRPGMAALLAGVALFYLAVIFALASPRLGANLGGTLSAAAAFGVSQAGLVKLVFPHRPRLSWKGACAFSVSLFALLSLALLWALNIRAPQANPSHVGRFGEMFQQRGLEVFWETASRKLAMNWRLVRYSIWSRVFVTFLGLQGLLFFYPLGLLKSLKQEQPYLLLGMGAALVGSIAALLTNDSGVVAAATMLLFGVPPVLEAMIRQRLEGTRNKLTA